MESIAIVSNWHEPKPGAGFRELADLVLPNRRDYARAHGYGCLEFNRAGHYGKIAALLAAWGSAEWLWWLDIDAIITRSELGLERLATEADVVISCDAHGINSGSMLLRTVPEVRRILFRALEMQPAFDFPPWHEQNALAYLLWLIRDRVRIVDRSALNSYPADWTPESFVLHCPGMSNKARVQWLGRHLANKG